MGKKEKPCKWKVNSHEVPRKQLLGPQAGWREEMDPWAIKRP